MDTLTTEQNFQLTQAIDTIDFMAQEVLADPYAEAVLETQVFCRR